MTLPTDSQVQILLVEDEAVLALDLCDTLEADGYRVVGTARSGPRALSLFQQHRVDLVLCDIHIQGEWDGIETATRLQAERPVPLIYLTAHADQATLERALRTGPAAYLTKPATMASLRAAIILALQRFAEPAPAPAPDRDLHTRDTILQLGDHVFIKDNYQFVRIPLRDIQVLEADNTYTTLITTARKYALRLSLGAVLERLRFPALVRVHRSFALNIEQVEAFSEAEATVAGQLVPLGRQYKENFLQQFQPR
ncbi:DNA-binding response regulator [Hymenobacter aquaticus]|uniref:DNA-binding response regulator n=1 Tax=Hymenobacter aquaticus TaxID=1867101 RepID=A0A4Z0Q4G2_9BACT|nr:response regulator [Hymenobacter aquaticus]TGE24013.1 DNA-binding response regulator [Hymenobacter aquaticus]